jgi:hypothetical protein
MAITETTGNITDTMTVITEAMGVAIRRTATAVTSRRRIEDEFHCFEELLIHYISHTIY